MKKMTRKKMERRKRKKRMAVELCVAKVQNMQMYEYFRSISQNKALSRRD